MYESRLDLPGFGGALDRAEQNRRIGLAGLQPLFGDRQRRLALSIPPQGFASFDIKFGSGGIHQRGPVVFEPAGDLPQLQTHPGPGHESELIIGILREMRIEHRQSLLGFPETSERTAHERSRGMSTGREFLDPGDFVETRLPFPVLDMGRGKLHAQIDVPGSHQEPGAQVGDDIVVGSVTAQRGDPDWRNQKENQRDP